MEHGETVHPSGPGGGGSNPLLTLDPGMAIWTWVVFFILLVLLTKFAWRPILKTLDDREKAIKKSLDDAEEARKRLEEAAVQQSGILGKARDEALSIIEKGRATAQSIALEVETKARHEAERMIEAARHAIDNQKDKAVLELRKEAASLAIRAASKLIAENLDDARNRKLVEAYITEVTG